MRSKIMIAIAVLTLLAACVAVQAQIDDLYGEFATTDVSDDVAADDGQGIIWSVTASIPKYVSVSGNTTAAVDLGAAQNEGWTWDSTDENNDDTPDLYESNVPEGATPARPDGWEPGDAGTNLAAETLTSTINTNCRLMLVSQYGTPLGIKKENRDGYDDEYYYLPMDFAWYFDGKLDWSFGGMDGGQWGFQDYDQQWLRYNCTNPTSAERYWEKWDTDGDGEPNDVYDTAIDPETAVPLAVETTSWNDYINATPGVDYTEVTSGYMQEGQEFTFNQVFRFYRNGLLDPAGDYTMDPEGTEGAEPNAYEFPTRTILYNEDSTNWGS